MTMSQKERLEGSTEYKDGEQAYKDGLDETKNPHAYMTTTWSAWEQGHRSAKAAEEVA